MILLRKIRKTINSIFYLLIKKQLMIMDNEETIRYIVKNKKSVVRYGDGEMNIMLGGCAWFQEYNDSLSIRLKEISKSCDNKILICVPGYINSVNKNNEIDSKTKKFWRGYSIKCGGYFRKYFNNNYLYGDANISLFYNRKKNRKDIEKHIYLLKKIWDNKNIICIEGKENNIGVNNDLFDNASTVKKVICPNKNAYRLYDKILKYIISVCDKNTIIICSLGPTATVLCYDLCSKYNVMSYDLGHFDLHYNLYLRSILSETIINKDFEIIKDFTKQNENVLNSLINKNGYNSNRYLS